MAAKTARAAVRDVWARVAARSEKTHRAYKARMAVAAPAALSCGNLAHACAACEPEEKAIILASDSSATALAPAPSDTRATADLRGGGQNPHYAGDGAASGAAADYPPVRVGIVTAYNDMLSAHQPFERFPPLIRGAARRAGGVAQVAGGVPAMCDGITQGQTGMELSLFSRDVIAMASAVALSHNVFSAAMFLGVCDKIAPGMVIAAATFGHLPAVFAPAGPMPSGIANSEKARVRERYAAGEVGRAELLAAETASYHAPGTCTFYGTANTNQAMLEIMGLQMPGASFINPNTPLRDALTAAATAQVCDNARRGRGRVADILSPAAFVNATVGVLATGGSTNHTMHLPAMARACGVVLDWDDFAALSAVVPLLARLYPNGQADVNHFHAAGGMSFLVGELLAAGLLIDEEVTTVVGDGLEAYTKEPKLAPKLAAGSGGGGGGVARQSADRESTESPPAHEACRQSTISSRGGQNPHYAGAAGKADYPPAVKWSEGCKATMDESVLRGVSAPFSANGGLLVARGNLGEAVVKVSALPAGLRRVCAPARVFHSQGAMMRAFYDGRLDEDFVCVVRFQGARANGMPELHKLTPLLATLQDGGRAVALVSDGRMSGASGKVPAAIHVSPEAARGGAIAKVRDGDMICLDLDAGTLDALVAADEWAQRKAVPADLSGNEFGCGRELFGWMRQIAATAEEGGGVFFNNGDEDDNAR